MGTVLILGSSLTIPRCYLSKQDFEGAKRFVESNAGSDEPIVAVRLAARVYSRYYAPDWAPAQDMAELRAALRPERRAWLVYTLSPEIRAFEPGIWETIENDFEVVEVFWGTLGGGEVYVCRQKGALSKL